MKNWEYFYTDFRKRENGLKMIAESLRKYKILMRYAEDIEIYERQLFYGAGRSHGELRSARKNFIALADSLLFRFEVALNCNKGSL